MKKPNLFLVGAVKAGTTAVYQYLHQHPEIGMSKIKEPFYFAKDIKCEDFSDRYKRRVLNLEKYFSQEKLERRHIAYVENINQYMRLFDHCLDGKYLGEASAGYLYSEVAAKEIYKFNQKSKILIILRNPMERAFSHWLMLRRMGLSDAHDFIKAVEKDYDGNEKGWGISDLYVELGMYYHAVQRYLRVFPEKNVKIMLYDDLVKDSRRFMGDVFTFLGITNDVCIDCTEKHNKSILPRSDDFAKIVERFNLRKKTKNIFNPKIKKIFKEIYYSNVEVPKITDKEKLCTSKYFYNDIMKTASYIEKDLSIWLK